MNLSEDGLNQHYATNGKMLYDAIVYTGYDVDSIKVYDYKKSELIELPFTYKNIVKSININNNYNVVFSCYNDNSRVSIDIKELSIFK